MLPETNVIIYFLKILIINIYCFYSFEKIINVKIKKYHTIFIIIFNIFIALLGTIIEFFINPFALILLMVVVYGIFLGYITKKNIGYSIVVTIISYAICLCCFVVSIIISYLPYKFINIENNYLNLILILIMQFLLIYLIFKTKRFKKGFDFFDRKLNNDYFDIIMLNIGVAIIFLYSIFSTIFYEIEEIRKSLLISFMILGVIMFIVVHKNLTLYYKQKLLKTTVNSYKEKIEEKELEINKLKDEKYKISKIVHEFYNRQEALEQAVKDEEFRKRIKNLTTEFSNEFEKIKTLDKLEKTEIVEIDDMFKYMQKECDKNNIKFHLKIEGNIHYLINNIIPKNKLETLIGDHIRDAINAVKSSNEENREILVILGKKDENYELTIFDTGIEFEIDTLLKLGKERVTTYKNKGGNGIGFMTTFETMKETGASLIIEEFQPNKDRFYTKSVTIKFDGKNQYKVISYRQNLLVK